MAFNFINPFKKKNTQQLASSVVSNYMKSSFNKAAQKPTSGAQSRAMGMMASRSQAKPTPVDTTGRSNLTDYAREQASKYGSTVSDQNANMAAEAKRLMAERQAQDTQKAQAAAQAQAQAEAAAQEKAMREEARRAEEEAYAPYDARRQREMEDAKKLQELQNAAFDRQTQNLQKRASQLPGQQAQQIAAIEEAKKRSVAGLQENLGSTLRGQAQSKRELDAQRQQTFANLGTIDSGGYYGFSGQQFNADQELLRQQAEARQKTQASIDQAESTAQNEINTTVAEFTRMIDDINNAIYTNEDQRKIDAQKAYSELQQRLYAIEDTYNQRVDQANQFMMELEQKASNTSKDFTNELKLNDKYMAEMKAYNVYDVMSSYDRIINSNASTPEGQVAILYAYIKLLDPATGVKEGEFNNIARAQSLVQKAQAELQKATSGGFADRGFVQQLQEQAKVIAQPTINRANEIQSKYSNYGSQYGLNTDLITSGGVVPSNQGSTGATSTGNRFTIEGIE